MHEKGKKLATDDKIDDENSLTATPHGTTHIKMRIVEYDS